MRGGRQTPRHPRLHPWTESTSASASVSAATLAQSATARPTGWVCRQRGGSTTPPSAPATLPPLPLSPSQGSCHHGRLGAAAVTTALSAAGVSSAYVVAKAAPVSATLQLGGDFLLSVSRCTRTRATDGSVPVATLRYSRLPPPRSAPLTSPQPAASAAPSAKARRQPRRRPFPPRPSSCLGCGLGRLTPHRPRLTPIRPRRWPRRSRRPRRVICLGLPHGMAHRLVGSASGRRDSAGRRRGARGRGRRASWSPAWP